MVKKSDIVEFVWGQIGCLKNEFHKELGGISIDGFHNDAKIKHNHNYRVAHAFLDSDKIEITKEKLIKVVDRVPNIWNIMIWVKGESLPRIDGILKDHMWVINTMYIESSEDTTYPATLREMKRVGKKINNYPTNLSMRYIRQLKDWVKQSKPFEQGGIAGIASMIYLKEEDWVRPSMSFDLDTRKAMLEFYYHLDSGF